VNEGSAESRSPFSLRKITSTDRCVYMAKECF
jgi:hypothetical protein